MLTRYTRPEMGRIWTTEARFEFMLKVEVAVAQVQGEMGMIPVEAAQAIKSKAKIDVAAIDKIEQTTRHDVIAFVTQVAESVGNHGRFLHFGLTSSDVLDTALSLQMAEGAVVLQSSLKKWESALIRLTEKHRLDWCSGRTHGMHAEPTTFGLKLSGHLSELRRCQRRLDRALAQMKVGKLSGAVGTYSALGPELEKKVCALLGLKAEVIATQVIPRDRHAEVMWSLCLIGCCMERLSLEFRHLQRTEVREVSEGFTPGQKGSSAMPHKKNPIGFENLTGVARMLRSYLTGSLENVALWHERDISHSSVERIFIPDAFILADYGASRMAQLLSQLQVDVKQMQFNMNLSQGQLFSSHLLLSLVQKGMTREMAYQLVQSLSHNLSKDGHLLQAAQQNSQVASLLTQQELEKIFSGENHARAIQTLIDGALNNETGGW
ncbi:MAG: adenylosuccinate lyase [Bdellovibrionales bacterium]|nr:adenylosuccinate lyase [Bdellovibrionales bacterium]